MRFINPETRGRSPSVYESHTNRGLVHNYFIARKYCVLSRYVANNYINDFPANTFFYAQTTYIIVSNGPCCPGNGL